MPRAVERPNVFVNKDELVILDMIAGDNNNASWWYVHSALVKYIDGKCFTHGREDRWSHKMLDRIDDMPRAGSESYLKLRKDLLHACVPKESV